MAVIVVAVAVAVVVVVDLVCQTGFFDRSLGVANVSFFERQQQLTCGDTS